MVVLDGQEHFSMWHIFLIVRDIPTVLAVIGLLLLPESPRILLAIGHEREALVIYQVRNISHLTIDFQSISFGWLSPSDLAQLGFDQLKP